MQSHHWLKPGALGLLFGAFLLAALASCAGAGESQQRYRFDVLDQPVPVGAHRELTVKITDASTGQPVQGATLTGFGDIEMAHMRLQHKGSPTGGMTTMSGDVKFIGSSGPGLYQLMADVSMPGKWKLDLSANIPGETKPIVNTVKFQAGR
jgi:YtkA-like protein